MTPGRYHPQARRPRLHRVIHRGEGFTLLEILTAMVILAIVVTLVFSSFDTVFSSADQINTGSDRYEMGSACIARIKADLEALHIAQYPRYKPPDIDDDPELYRIEGSEKFVGGNSFSTLRFTSLAHLPLNQENREGIAEIVYYVQSTDTNEFVLKRADKLYPYPERFEENELDPTLCEGLRAFKLTFHDQEEREQDSWNSESKDYDYTTPRSVGVELVLGNEEDTVRFKTEVLLPMVRNQAVKK